MASAAVSLLIHLSVESFKFTSRCFYKRKSRKHGYSDLRTDSLGRPLSEQGKRLTRNEARALAAHNQELERIRTAEREWRAEGERLPRYDETNNDLLARSMPRPRTAPAVASVATPAFASDSQTSVSASTSGRRSCCRGGRDPPRIRALSAAPAPSRRMSAVRSRRATRASRTSVPVDASTPTLLALDGGAFTIRRQAPSPVPPPAPDIDDIFQHDGMDWRRATWEASPIYRPPSVGAVATPTPSLAV